MRALRKFLEVAVLSGIFISLSISEALSIMPVEVASGYKVEKVATGVVPVPTSIAFGPDGKLYVTSLSGFIMAVDTTSGVASPVLFPGALTMPVGLAFHPYTGKMYVTDNYVVPGGNPLVPDDVKSRISIIDMDDGGVSINTFVDGIPSMFFEELPIPVTGSQGIDFDSDGNLYVAQGINDYSREVGDPLNSAILKIDEDGHVSVFASGLRSPYDVVVAKEDRYGRARALYAGDNGEGEECEGCPDPYAPSRMYHDELNMVVAGAYYGWPDNSLGNTRDPLWEFGPLDPSDDESWPVPTGIETWHGKWGSSDSLLFLAFFNCRSLFGRQDIGTIEMFTGNDYTKRITLAWFVDAPIDVTMGPDKRLYFIEYLSGDIYRITPDKKKH